MEENKENSKKSEDIDIKLLNSRSVMLFDGISKKSANEVCKRLLVLDQENSDPIKLYVNSPGGDVDAGLQIFDTIRFIKSPVTIICNGLVASAATLVLVSVPAERRISTPNSRYLIHQPSSGVQGSVADVEIYAREIEKLRHALNEILQQGTGQPIERIEKDTNRDCWMDAKEALEYGLISRIVTKSEEI